MDRRKDLETNRRMLIQLSRFLGVDSLRSIYYLPFDSELSDVVKIASDCGPLDLLIAPTKLGRYYLRIFSNSDRVAFGVLILAIYRCGKGLNRITISMSKALV